LPLLGLCRIPIVQGRGNITIDIYFLDGRNMIAEQLYHTVGHELEHAHHAASGDYYEWVEQWGEAAAGYYSEYLAYKWNVDHLHIASYPGARRHYEGGVNYYAQKYLEARGAF